jgi:PKD repeat protein
MKKIVCFFVFISFCFSSNSQTILWSEDFGTGCNQGQSAVGFTTSNGTWTESQTGSNALESNLWFISATEAGTGLGQCGDGCGSNSNLTNRTLHIGANDGITTTDGGASYNAGGFCGLLFCTTTDRRIESPSINCTGNSNITLSFSYIEGGQGAIDDASCWYFDGNVWSLLVNMPKTTLCGAQGLWDSIQVSLPASANNNPNVKIGFRWVNDDTDGTGTDPSIAIDDVVLFVADDPIPSPVAAFSSSKTEVCQGQCLDFSDQSTNIPTSWSWSFYGANIGNSTDQNPIGICYDYPGTYLVSLVVSNTFGSDSLGVDNYITVLAAPALPTVTQVGNTLASSYTSGNQWFLDGNQIPNATDSIYTITESGVYFVEVTDANGCSSRSSNLELTFASINDLEGKETVVYPNPVSRMLFIQTDAEELVLMDIIGQNCAKIQVQGKMVELDVSNLSKGVYFLKTDKTGVQKVLVIADPQ